MPESKQTAAPTLTGDTTGGTLKAGAQQLLRRLGIYHRLKSSYLYDLYWGIADRKLIENRRKEVDFYRRTLDGFKAGDLIFDVGANIGQKTDIFLRLGGKVVAVEPDPLNQEVLQKSFLSYRLAKKPVVIVGKAVSSDSGLQKMWIDEPGSAKNTLSPKWVETLRTDTSRFGRNLDFEQVREVATTTLEDLIKCHGIPFYVKIDVEGHEVNVIKGLRTAVPFLSFEVNLPQFRPEALECVNALERIAGGGNYNYAPDCLRGLALPTWQPKRRFVDLLSNCEESCIEVFWRGPVSLTSGH
jgi:FkbM family methyltransferase